MNDISELPTVSVVIPNRNQGRYLSAAVESVLTGHGVSRELLVVDDGSTDDSRELLDCFAGSHAGVVRILHRDGGGACGARNAGLAAALGQFVKFLDADDELEPRSLDRQVLEMAASDGEPVSVYGDVEWVDEDGSRLPDPPPPAEGLTEAEWMILHAPLTSAPLHRTEDVRRVGGFDERVPRGQEYDLHIRMWLAGVRFEYHPGVVYRYRQHGGPRISGADGDAAVARGRLESLLRHVELARGKLGDQLPPDAATAFARNLWRNGRRCLQAGGSRKSAAGYFDAARGLAGGRAVVGGRAYRALCVLTGPAWAEGVGTFPSFRRWASG